MTGKELARLAAALALGAAIALPVGMMLGGDGAETPVAPAPRASATARALFAPKVLSDPYFIEQQRLGIEALEKACRERGELCEEARAGRRWLDQAH